MSPEDVDHLACPRCSSPLVFSGDLQNGSISNGELGCRGCACAWPLRDGLPWLFDESAVSPVDGRMRFLYDWFAPVHDLAITWLLPLLQWSTEASLRQAYIERLELGTLRPREDGKPLRILEVGAGCGANIPLLARALSPDVRVEIWALDLSEGMMQQCRRSWRQHGSEPIRYLMADAHALPFPPETFDRVFHVGGIAAFGDPARALDEMARVARPGTPIVVVDEQLAETSRRSLYQSAVFGVFAWLAPSHGAPVEDLPRDAYDVLAEQISAFYYCLRFRVPEREDPQPRRVVPEPVAQAAVKPPGK